MRLTQRDRIVRGAGDRGYLVIEGRSYVHVSKGDWRITLEFTRVGQIRYAHNDTTGEDYRTPDRADTVLSAMDAHDRALALKSKPPTGQPVLF